MPDHDNAAVAEPPADGIGQDVLERKTLNFQVKSIGDGAAGAGSFVCYAAEFNTVDRANEKIERGAFKNLDEFVQDGFMALGHDLGAMPLGTITNALQDDYGLLVSGDFHSTPVAQHARTIMRERMDRGKSVKLSIGYVVRKDARVTEGGKSYRLLKEIDVHEFSWVNLPANSAAVAVAIKGHPAMTDPSPATPETTAPSSDTVATPPPEPTPAAETPEPEAKDALAPLATKGQFLGDTDEPAAAAAADRLHCMLGYLVCAAAYSDAPKATVMANVAGAIDEYRDAVLNIFNSLLTDDDPEDGPAMPPDDMAAMPAPEMATSSAPINLIAQKYLAKLATFDISRDGSVSDLSFDSRSKGLVSDLAGFTSECLKRHDIRVKSGRVLSATNRQRIADVHKGLTALMAELDSLLNETEPEAAPMADGKAAPAEEEKKAAPTPAAVSVATRAAGNDGIRLYTEYLLSLSRANGVPV